MKPTRSHLSKAQFFFASTTLLAAIFAITCAIFYLHIKSTTAYGKSEPLWGLTRVIIGENVQENQQLFKINDTYGYVVSGTTVAAVRYAKSSYPLCFACGTYILDGNAVNSPLKQDHYLFAQFPNAAGEYAVLDLTTSEYQKITDLSQFKTPLTIDSATPVSVEEATHSGEALLLRKESCLIITVAELVLLTQSILLYLFFLIKEKRK